MAIGEVHVGIGIDVDIAVEVDGAGTGQDVLGLAAVGAGVHAQRAADRARDAAIESEAGNAGVGRGTRHLDVGDGRSNAQRIAILDPDLAETLAEPDDDAGHTAVAHQQVGAEADDVDRHVVGERLEEVGQVGFVGGCEQHLRRTADAEPGDVGKRGVGDEAAAQLRHQRLQIAGHILKHQATPPARRGAFPSHSGKACAHSVELPAPRQTTVSPGFARSLIMGASAPASSTE